MTENQTCKKGNQYRSGIADVSSDLSDFGTTQCTMTVSSTTCQCQNKKETEPPAFTKEAMHVKCDTVDTVLALKPILEGTPCPMFIPDCESPGQPAGWVSGHRERRLSCAFSSACSRRRKPARHPCGMKLEPAAAIASARAFPKRRRRPGSNRCPAGA